MTVGLLPSSDKAPSETKILAQPDKSEFAIPSILTTTKLGAFVLFCWQHPDFLKLIFQCIFSSIVLGFCIVQLANGGRDGQGKNDALYWGGITSILAWWMPSPGSPTAKNQANVVAEEMNVKATVTSSVSPSATDHRAASN